MPGFILHAGASVVCSHGGQALPTATFPRMRVAGQPVTTLGPPYTIAGCALPPPPAGSGPCLTAQWVTGATRVWAGGQPVLVQSSQAVCAPTGTPLHIVQTQTRVRAV